MRWVSCRSLFNLTMKTSLISTSQSLKMTKVFTQIDFSLCIMISNQEEKLHLYFPLLCLQKKNICSFLLLLLSVEPNVYKDLLYHTTIVTDAMVILCIQIILFCHTMINIIFMCLKQINWVIIKVHVFFSPNLCT